MDANHQQGDSPSTSNRECPVCFQIPRAHIFQCANGHSICDLCSTKVTVCPTCRSSGVRIRNRLAESLLDEIQFNCNWSRRGCDKTMLRGLLSAHEDQCDQNPHIIKLCDFFSKTEQSCQFKFTPTWLSEPKNCNEFIMHMKTHHNYFCQENAQIGQAYSIISPWFLKPGLKISSSKAVHRFSGPRFYRFRKLDSRKEQLFFRVLLLKADSYGNTAMSWVLVQLTPEITPVVTRLKINGNANCKMVSQWGQQSSSTLSWTVKPILFKEFNEMGAELQNSEEGLSFPYSLPISFLSEYYVSDDNKLMDVMTFELRA